MSFSFSDLDFMKPELGAEYTGAGTHFAVFSAHAEQVELCLYSEDGKKEVARRALPKREGDIWSGYIAGVGPGTVYGYRVNGPYDPNTVVPASETPTPAPAESGDQEQPVIQRSPTVEPKSE